MILRLVDAHAFKSLSGHRPALSARTVRRSDAPQIGVRKPELGEVERLDDRTLRFCISTGSIDRDLDRINQTGWKLDHFAKNPRVLWSHNASMPPIGKAVNFAVKGDRLMSDVQFLPEEGYGDASAWADQIYRLAKDGWLSATSVGFRPLAWDFTDDPGRGADDWWPGIDFHEAELVEFSLVNVPANPEALVEPIEVIEPELDPIAAETAAFATRERRRRALALLAFHPGLSGRVRSLERSPR